MRSNRHRDIDCVHFIGVGATGIGGSIPPIVNLGDNSPTFGMNYVHNLFNNVAEKAI